MSLADRDRIIAHFQDAIKSSWDNNKWRFVRADILEDAIAALMEHEPVKPIEQTETITRYKCGFCGNRLYLKEHKFCHWCGRAVKWDECEIQR